MLPDEMNDFSSHIIFQRLKMNSPSIVTDKIGQNISQGSLYELLEKIEEYCQVKTIS
jgi:hypothetical protein